MEIIRAGKDKENEMIKRKYASKPFFAIDRHTGRKRFYVNYAAFEKEIEEDRFIVIENAEAIEE